MGDILALGLNATPKTRAIPVCLDGDIEDRLIELGKQLTEAQSQDAQSFSGNQAKKILDQIKELQAAAAGHSVTFHLRKLPYLRPLELQAEHPPRDEDAGDQTHGFNRESYYPALVRECCYQVSHPDGDTLDADQLTDAWWTGVFAAVNYRQFDALFSAAYTINHQDAAAPFLRAASRSSQTSGDDSKQPGAGESPRSGSQDGSPAPEPSTPTTPTGSFSSP